MPLGTARLPTAGASRRMREASRIDVEFKLPVHNVIGGLPPPSSDTGRQPWSEERRPGRSFLGDWRDLRASLIVGFCCLLVYNANGRSISAGDTYPTRYLPFAILRHHTLVLDPVARIAAQGRGQNAYWMQTAPSGRIISLYPVVQPVLIAPLYLPAIRYLDHRDWADWRVDHVARVMEKVTASLVAALSASLLYLLVRRGTTMPTAVLLTVAYALGTTTWMISSQALWQHGMGQLLVVGALLFLTAPCTASGAIAAGLLCGLIAGNRPPDSILAAALGIVGLLWAGRRSALFIAAAALPMSLVLFYNLDVAGHVGGGYFLAGNASFFRHNPLTGLAGLLFSPTRGLFVFSPFLLFLVLSWRHPPRDRRLSVAITIGVVVQVLLYSLTDWRTGIAWGPRFLTDLVPMLVWLLIPVATALRGFGRALFLATVGIAVAIEAIGALCYTGVTDTVVMSVAKGPDMMKAAWDWRNAPFIASLRFGRAAADLLIGTRGFFDAVEYNGESISVVAAGQDVALAGWALADHGTPNRVAVVVDGRQPVVTRTFFDRRDVRETLGEESPAGWRIPLSTAGLAPGEHQLVAYVWALDRGEGHYLAERTLTVQPADSDLAAAFQTAAARVREHQQAPGYWLTAYTTTVGFNDPHPEMNTYLTALLIDLLDPLAAAGNFSDSLTRARTHLTSQVEASGLVRYHGLPDGPGIGTLGCAITPDSDDTSLVWRIAPPGDRGRLSAALTTLARYRTGEGLYRTWLAPRDAYQCLDPGRDPNPADFTIQAHVLQMLAREQPAGARALCTALRTVVDQDKVWVYYARAPLVPMLRLPDLERAGCKVELPESRMRTSVPGQEIWVSVVRLLTRVRTPGGSPADAAEARRLLADLARDDFALLRKDPPLLYHNDLTATVSRYYWSEDAGYALWLRLAHENALIGH
jgi:hypothetical protein